jgi:hypothetical protein
MLQTRCVVAEAATAGELVLISNVDTGFVILDKVGDYH